MDNANPTNSETPPEPTNPAKFNVDKLSIPGAIIIAGLIIAGAILYSNGALKGGPAALNPPEQTRPTPPPPFGSNQVEVSADDDAVLGNPNAPVVLIEFSDFQCPFCRRFWEQTLPTIKKDYIDTGKAKFVYRDFPLSFHEGAQPYAEAAECAEDQGKFWQMHDKIFEEQQKLGQGTIQYPGKEILISWGGQIGLNLEQFRQCLDSGKYTQEVQKDFQDGVTAGVDGTPTVFINGIPVRGARPLTDFISVIEQELQKSIR